MTTASPSTNGAAGSESFAARPGELEPHASDPVSPGPSAAYQLVELAGGVRSVHSLAYGETFHPVVGPEAEAQALYVKQLQLAERMRAQREFVLWDVGLGAAANPLTVLRATRQLDCLVRLVSFDQTVAALQFALSHADALGYLSGYEAGLQQLSKQGQVCFKDGNRQVQWDLHLADFPTLLTEPVATRLPKPHAIMFDAFSPARNPAMWTAPLFQKLFGLLDPARPCALPTYSRSTMLRVTLLLAGFYVGVGHATGEKEETTIAANSLDLIPEPLERSWLQRARRSNSAEPLWEPAYRQAPLTPQTWQRLNEHPQFR